MVADVEYGFDPEHEAFNSIDVLELGYDANTWSTRKRRPSGCSLHRTRATASWA